MDGCLQSDKRDVSYQVSQVKPIRESSSIPSSKMIPVPFLARTLRPAFLASAEFCSPA